MNTLKRHGLAFGCALQFLTLIPVRLPGVPERRIQALAMLYYPLVGLLIGVLLGLTAWLSAAFPVELQATLVLLVWCGVTGGLHLDGLADTADGWMGGLGDRVRTLAIMKDPHIGATGVIALLLQLLLKWSLLLALPGQSAWIALLLAPAAGRAAALLLLATTPYARSGGIASDMLGGLSRRRVYWIAAVVGLGLLWAGLLWLLLPACLLWGGRALMLRRLNGATGDTSGALIELTESLVLFAAVCSYFATGVFGTLQGVQCLLDARFQY